VIFQRKRKVIIEREDGGSYKKFAKKVYKKHIWLSGNRIVLNVHRDHLRLLTEFEVEPIQVLYVFFSQNQLGRCRHKLGSYKVGGRFNYPVTLSC
jgi:hypothetical protein